MVVCSSETSDWGGATAGVTFALEKWVVNDEVPLKILSLKPQIVEIIDLQRAGPVSSCGGENDHPHTHTDRNEHKEITKDQWRLQRSSHIHGS